MHANQHIQKADTCRLCSLDPRTKLVSVIFTIGAIVILQAGEYIRFSILSVWLLIIILFSHQSFGFYLKSILRIYPMIFFMTMILPFTGTQLDQPVKIVFSLGSIHIYHDGLLSFLDINIRSILLFTSSLIVINETPFSAMLKTLSVLHIPKWIEAILIYMQRFMHLIALEFSRMHLAFSARSFNMSLYNKTKAIAKISGVYLSRLIDHSERSHIAMVSRGFNGEIYTRYQMHWRLHDTCVLLFNLLFILLITTSQWVI